MSYTATYTHGCDRCPTEVVTKDLGVPDNWVDTPLFAPADKKFYTLCPQCVANLARWFEPPDTKGVKATKRRTRRARAK